MKCLLFLLMTLVISQTVLGSNMSEDSVYCIYLRKVNSYDTIIVKAGDKVKLKTAKAQQFKKYSLISISPDLVELSPTLTLRPDEIYSIKKLNRKNSIVGSVFLAVGLGLFASGVPYILTEDDGAEFKTFLGEALMVVGIIIMTPPVFKKKKNASIEFRLSENPEN